MANKDLDKHPISDQSEASALQTVDASSTETSGSFKLNKSTFGHYEIVGELEARAQARVQHENVCRVYEVGEVEGKQYIAMQLIEGKSLYASSKEMSVESKIR